MNTAVLLCIVIALTFALKKGASPYFRTFSLSIFGLCFFCIWNPLVFALELHNSPPWLLKSVLPSLVIIASGILILPTSRNVGLITTSIVTTFFFISAIGVLAFDYKIKNSIAEWLGYFDYKFVKSQTNDATKFNTVTDDASGISVALPETWKKRTNTPNPEFERLKKDGLTDAEMEISCFHGSSKPIVNIINDYAIMHERFTGDCGQNEDFYICRIEYQDLNTSKEVWRYLAFAKNSKQRAEIQIRSSLPKSEIASDVERILQSASVKTIKPPYAACLSSMHWF